jgi:hypothetical protein
MSPEAREKLSRLAKQRHAEGRFGGPQFGRLGGRPRKRRLSERVAETAQEEQMARQVIQVFKDALQPNQPMSIRLKGAMALHEIEREEGKLALQEIEQEARQHSRDELVSILAEKLTSGPTASILRRQIEANVVDGHAVEVE